MQHADTPDSPDPHAAGDASRDLSPPSLSGGILNRASQRPAAWQTALLAGAGLLVTVYLIRNAGDLGSIRQVIADRQNRLWAFFGFTNLYLLIKGLALRQSAGAYQVRTSLWRTTRVFCESSVVGLTVAKIAADVYKFARVGDGTRGNRVRAILLYRVSAIMAVLVLSGVVSILWAETIDWRSILIWLVPIVVITGLLLGFASRVRIWITDHGRNILAVLPWSLAALAAKIGGLAALLGVTLEGELVEVAAAFLLIGSLASMTQIPAGLGMLDAGYAFFLTRYVGANGAEAAAFLIAFRLLGPVYVSALGLLSMAGTYLSAARNRSRSQIDPSTA